MKIMYRYAANTNGKVSEISEINKENRESLAPFLCVGCGASMVARLGDNNTHHFAHASGDGCGTETYLHRLGKKLFIQNYKDCLKDNRPFFVVLETKNKCTHFDSFLTEPCQFVTHEKYDLTKYFDDIGEEVWTDGLKPDVLLSSKAYGDQIFIEIAVSHLSSDDKISSGKKIIEYILKNEDDLDLLKMDTIDFDILGINFYNFNPKTKFGDLCSGSCNHKFTHFCVSRRGRIVVLHATPSELKEKTKENAYIYHSPCRNPSDQNTELKSFIKKAVKRGIAVRSCLVCIHSRSSTQYAHGFNCAKHNVKTPDESVRCSDFSINRDL